MHTQSETTIYRQTKWTLHSFKVSTVHALTLCWRGKNQYQDFTLSLSPSLTPLNWATWTIEWRCLSQYLRTCKSFTNNFFATVGLSSSWRLVSLGKLKSWKLAESFLCLGGAFLFLVPLKLKSHWKSRNAVTGWRDLLSGVLLLLLNF